MKPIKFALLVVVDTAFVVLAILPTMAKVLLIQVNRSFDHVWGKGR